MAEKKKINRFAVLRILIGIFFIFSGLEKLLKPYQNFLYVVQSYDMLPAALNEIVARLVPWVEFILGSFLFLGFWLKFVLPGLWGLVIIFLMSLGQAMIRNLPLKECGCFGELISVPLPVTFLFDSFLLIISAILFSSLARTSFFSLDNYFLKQK